MDIRYLERMGEHKKVDNILFRMAQVDVCMFCGKSKDQCECYQEEEYDRLDDKIDYETNSLPQIIHTLEKSGVTDISRPFTNILRFTKDGETYIIDDFENPRMREAYQWVWDLSDWELEEYAPSPDLNKEFWESGGRVYHGTTVENWQQIQKDGGLDMRDETRGLTNRGTGQAIFTSYNPHDTSYYGEVTLAINVDQMIADGYTPRVQREGPIDEAMQRRSIAYRLGLNEEAFSEDSSDGMSEDTVIFFDSIPLKYISVTDEDEIRDWDR